MGICEGWRARICAAQRVGARIGAFRAVAMTPASILYRPAGAGAWHEKWPPFGGHFGGACYRLRRATSRSHADRCGFWSARVRTFQSPSRESSESSHADA